MNKNKTNVHPLQTPDWAEFRKKWGNEVVETPHGYLTLHPLPFTSYKIGMFLKGDMPTPKMVEYLRNEGKKLKLIFIKIEPNYVVKKDNILCANKDDAITLLRKNGAVAGKTLFTPTTFWIDLTKSEEELLKSFSSKTRYNIRLAERKGVRVQEDNSDKAFEKYIELTRETVTRDKFFTHNERYHHLMWETLKKQIAHLLTATYNHEIITAWVLFECNGFLYYPYGASTHKYKNIMANNLMMWEAIKFGKKQALSTFDLWGREPGKGFTKFKEGYNPQLIEFLGTWDLVINPSIYKLYKVAEKARALTMKLQAQLGLTKYRF
jgi:lipid II:glycine glycyltransferase (peptidoglycan interpeptide bridge formation enzyme)